MHCLVARARKEALAQCKEQIAGAYIEGQTCKYGQLAGLMYPGRSPLTRYLGTK